MAVTRSPSDGVTQRLNKWFTEAAVQHECNGPVNTRRASAAGASVVFVCVRVRAASDNPVDVSSSSPKDVGVHLK